MNITEQSSLNSFQKQVVAFLPESARVTSITLSRAGAQEKDIMESATVIYTSPEMGGIQFCMTVDLKDEPKTWNVGSIDELADRTYLYAYKGIEMSRIGFSRIPDILKKATQELDNRNMENAGVRQFTMELVRENLPPFYNFIIDGRSKGGEAVTMGGSPASNCYEVSFRIDTVGNWDIKVDEKPRLEQDGM